jgi:DNA-binding FadR family transcriptional regulator
MLGITLVAAQEACMDLRIHGGGFAPGAHDPQLQKRRQDYDALARALTEGDLPGANEAYATIIGQLPVGGKVSAESFLGKMGVALRSADLALARQLMASGGPRTAQVAGAAEASSSAPADGAGTSSALALNQAIQSGDRGRARAALQSMMNDLQQLATASGFSGASFGAAKAYATTSTAALAANTLLQNPNFRALEEAIARGDPTGMKAAWAILMNGAPPAATTARKPTSLNENESETTAAIWDMATTAVS